MIESNQISSVLSQIKATRSQMQANFAQASPQVDKPSWHTSSVAATELKGQEVKEVTPFATLLKEAINQVNTHQTTANDLRTRYEMGDPNVDLVNVMIASQKASVSFEAMAQVRNKLVTAYQEVMRMPI